MNWKVRVFGQTLNRAYLEDSLRLNVFNVALTLLQSVTFFVIMILAVRTSKINKDGLMTFKIALVVAFLTGIYMEIISRIIFMFLYELSNSENTAISETIKLYSETLFKSVIVLLFMATIVAVFLKNKNSVASRI